MQSNSNQADAFLCAADGFPFGLPVTVLARQGNNFIICSEHPLAVTRNGCPALSAPGEQIIAPWANVILKTSLEQAPTAAAPAVKPIPLKDRSIRNGVVTVRGDAVTAEDW
jgi:hypothetical protein